MTKDKGRLRLYTVVKKCFLIPDFLVFGMFATFMFQVIKQI